MNCTTYDPVGSEIAIPGGHLKADTPRGIAADYLEIELGRESEAAALRSAAQVAVDRGRVVVSLTDLLRRIDSLRKWLDAFVDRDIEAIRESLRTTDSEGRVWEGSSADFCAALAANPKEPPRLIGIGWHTIAQGFAGYLPNPDKDSSVRFVIEAPEHEFAATFAATIIEWVERFRPDAAAHPEWPAQRVTLTD